MVIYWCLQTRQSRILTDLIIKPNFYSYISSTNIDQSEMIWACQIGLLFNWFYIYTLR